MTARPGLVPPPSCVREPGLNSLSLKLPFGRLLNAAFCRDSKYPVLAGAATS
jgi:hypothetical protein